MATWTNDDILKLDLRYANEGIPLHQRPFRAAMELLGASFSIGFGGNPDVQRIMTTYRALIPDIDSTWPGLGVGIIASVDQVRKITLDIPFGDQGPREVWQHLGFTSGEDWWAWCRRDHNIAAQSSFAWADIHDLTYGLNELQKGRPETITLWNMARSNLEDIANALPTAFSVDSLIQPICLVAELAMKGALVWNGADPSSFKGPKGHDLLGLAARLITARKHRDDPLVSLVISRLPFYVQSRYSPAGLTRLQVVQLALGVQFVAASVVRRLSRTDLAAEVEATNQPNSRPSFFSGKA